MYIDSCKLKMLIKQRDAIRAWVEQQGAIHEQRQLDADSAERVYWHFGYQAALTDLIDAVADVDSRGNTLGIPN